MPFAQGEQIAVSDSLHDLAKDMGYQYTSKDDCVLKGFDGPQTIFFLEWDDSPKAEPPTEEASEDTPEETTKDTTE